MRLRRYTAAVALATAATVTIAGSPAWAGKPPAAAGKSPAAVSIFGKTPAAPAKPAPAAFTATGTVTAVNLTGRTLTVRPAKGAAVTIGVPAAATIVVNKSSGKFLSHVAVGVTATVTGTVTGAAYTATRVETSGKPANTVNGKIP